MVSAWALLVIVVYAAGQCECEHGRVCIEGVGCQAVLAVGDRCAPGSTPCAVGAACRQGEGGYACRATLCEAGCPQGLVCQARDDVVGCAPFPIPGNCSTVLCPAGTTCMTGVDGCQSLLETNATCTDDGIPCRAGLTCRSDASSSAATCQSVCNDCGSGYICETTDGIDKCVLDAGSVCKTGDVQGDCRAGTACMIDTRFSPAVYVCQKLEATCASVLCAEGLVCVQDKQGTRCVQQASSCTGSSQPCPAGLHCAEGRCRDGCESVRCGDGTQCYSPSAGNVSCVSIRECNVMDCWGDCGVRVNGTVGCHFRPRLPNDRCEEPGWPCPETTHCASTDASDVLRCISTNLSCSAMKCEPGSTCVQGATGVRCVAESLCQGHKTCSDGLVCDIVTKQCVANACTAMICGSGTSCVMQNERAVCISQNVSCAAMLCPAGSMCMEYDNGTAECVQQSRSLQKSAACGSCLAGMHCIQEGAEWHCVKHVASRGRAVVIGVVAGVGLLGILVVTALVLYRRRGHSSTPPVLPDCEAHLSKQAHYI